MSGAGAGRGGERRLRGAVAGCVGGVDGERVARPAHEAGDGVGRPGPGPDARGSVVDPVARDTDVVERSAPGERDRRRGRAGRDEVRRRGRRLRVAGAGGCRGRALRHRAIRGVPGSVVSLERDGVGRRALEAGIGIGERGRRTGGDAVQEGAIAGDADVVRRRAPGHQDRRLRRAGLLIRRRRGRSRVRGTGVRRGRDRAAGRRVADGVVGLDAQGVGRSAGQAGEGVARARSTGHERAASIAAIAGDTDVVKGCIPAKRHRGRCRG